MDKTQNYIDEPLRKKKKTEEDEDSEYLKQLEEKFGKGFALKEFIPNK